MKFKEYNYLKYKKTNFTKDKAKDICKYAKERNWDNNVYGEIHHIKPRSLGGSNSKRNLVKLTFPEHCFAHYLLAIIYPNSKMTFAFHMMITTKDNGKKINFSNQQSIFNYFKHFEKLRIEFINIHRNGNKIYEYSDEFIKNIQKKILKLLKNNNESQYTQKRLINELNLPSEYILMSIFINPLIDIGKLNKRIFEIGSSKRYTEDELNKIKEKVLDLIDYNNSDKLPFNALCKILHLNTQLIREKVIKPLINDGKLHKHAFHFGKALKYDEEDIKNLVKETKSILRNERVNLASLCKKLDIKLDTFIMRIKPLVENSKEWERLLTRKEFAYTITIDNYTLTDKTRNELLEYSSKNNIEYLEYNGTTHKAESLISNLNKISKNDNDIIFHVSDEEKYTHIHVGQYNIKINGKLYKNKTSQEIRELLSKYDNDRIILNDKNNLDKQFFIVHLSNYNKKYNGRLSITL